MDVGWMLDGWMLDVGWLEKAELKPTQPSLAGAWLSLAKRKKNGYNHISKCCNSAHIHSCYYYSFYIPCLVVPLLIGLIIVFYLGDKSRYPGLLYRL